MQAVASLVFAVIPILAYLWGIWIMDRYDREPIRLLLTHFLWGALGAVFFGILFSVVASSAVGSSDYFDAVIIAPVVEEITKGIFLLWSARDKRFDNITDGVVYGMAIGLGFGMTENFLYFMTATTPQEWVFLVIVRTLFSAVMHAMASGIFGAFVGITKFNLRRFKWPLRLVGLAAAMGMHFLWNASVMSSSELFISLGALFIIFSLFVIMILLQVSLMYENRLIVRELREETGHGLIPATHLNYLPYSSKRRLVGWLSPIIDRKEYVQLATRLAFRKSQSRFCEGKEQEEYLAEVDQIRSQIATLLENDMQTPAARLY